MQGSPERPPGRLRGEVGGEWRDGLGVVAGVVGELDRDGLGGALGHRTVQLLDGALGLDALVEADEAHSLGEPCHAKIRHVLCKTCILYMYPSFPNEIQHKSYFK